MAKLSERRLEFFPPWRFHCSQRHRQFDLRRGGHNLPPDCLAEARQLETTGAEAGARRVPAGAGRGLGRGRCIDPSCSVYFSGNQSNVRGLEPGLAVVRDRAGNRSISSCHWQTKAGVVRINDRNHYSLTVTVAPSLLVVGMACSSLK